MIKPITFQGTVNFKASLYALEIKSRFISQNNANGYYTNYGNEINYTSISSNAITIGTGAFVVQGRMCEVTSQEVVPVSVSRNKKGYILAVINTYQLNDMNSCKFVSRVSSDFEELDKTLVQEDTYSSTADSQNKKYELPIYSFEINETGEIIKITKLIEAIADYQKVYDLVKSYESIVNDALKLAQQANEMASSANSLATDAKAMATNAVQTSETAKSNAEYAAEVATDSMNRVDALSVQVVEKQGTKVTKDGNYQVEYNADETITIRDTIRIIGGNSVK